MFQLSTIWHFSIYNCLLALLSTDIRLLWCNSPNTEVNGTKRLLKFCRTQVFPNLHYSSKPQLDVRKAKKENISLKTSSHHYINWMFSTRRMTGFLIVKGFQHRSEVQSMLRVTLWYSTNTELTLHDFLK
jgi:hypothetical protein